jgi:hypothetical protein
MHLIKKDIFFLTCRCARHGVTAYMLECFQNQGDDKAWQFLASIMRFQFIIALVIAEHILHSTVYPLRELYIGINVCSLNSLIH